MTPKSRTSLWVAGGLAALGLAALIYVATVLGNRGLYADAHQTAGYTTGGDIGVLGVGIALLVAAVVVFWRSRKQQ